LSACSPTENERFSSRRLLLNRNPSISSTYQTPSDHQATASTFPLIPFSKSPPLLSQN